MLHYIWKKRKDIVAKELSVMTSFISITAIIILINFLVSYKGFKDQLFYNRYSFTIDAVKLQKDYKRLITSGFLHVGWSHLIFNMIALYFLAATLNLI